MTLVLGISAFYHDSAAAIVRDGEIVAAAQEERFSRKKHDPRFPKNAINYCLEEAFVQPKELDAIVFYDNSLLTFDRVVKNALTVAPRGEAEWVGACRSFFGTKTRLREFVREALGIEPRMLVTDHHMAHAASAFYPSPFEEAAILTVDGVGEWATCTVGRGNGTAIELVDEIRYPHSLGLFYSAFTYFCGFKVNSGEYKLMGLAPYGRPIYADLIREKLIDLREDGSFRLSTEYFGYLDGNVMTNEAFHSLFGGPPRTPEARITRREMDLAASVQHVLEDAMLRLAKHALRRTGSKNLVLAGGVALNCVANGKILRLPELDGIWIQPAAGDAGGALGAALLVSHQVFGAPRKITPGRDSQHASTLGPRFSSHEVRAFLERREIPYRSVPDARERAARIAGTLNEGKIVGVLSGRMEFGPRALGARSILGDARRADTQSVMNLKIKFRESFRPFAPAVLRDRVSEVFDLDTDSPYMLLVAPVRADRQYPTDWSRFEHDDDMIPVLNQPRSDLPAITHVDYSARIQTVTAEDNPEFHGILDAFRELTGCPVLVNTSFNVRGEPIVCSPLDAYRCFMRTEIDLLVLEDCLLEKSEQPAFADDQDWKATYELD